MQTLQFSESRPREVLICMLDKTREQSATRRAHELAASLENKVTERTEQLYTEQQKARETVRRLETRLEQKNAQVNQQSTNEFKKWLLAEMEEHYPEGADLPGRMPVMREYLRHCTNEGQGAVDLPKLFDDLLHESEILKSVRTVTQMPFSLVISEPAGLLSFLISLILEREPMLQRATLLKSSAEVSGATAQVHFSLVLPEGTDEVTPHPHFGLAEYITTTRFHGELNRQLSESGTLDIDLSIALYDHSDELLHDDDENEVEA